MVGKLAGVGLGIALMDPTLGGGSAVIGSPRPEKGTEGRAVGEGVV